MKKEDLMKENYKISNYIIMNSQKHTEILDRSYRFSEVEVYDVENELSDDEKLEIIDSLYHGIGTYLLNLIKKYLKDRESGVIKTTTYGYSLNVGSVRAWIRKNDTRGIMCNPYTNYSHGRYHLFENVREMSLDTPLTGYGYRDLYAEEPIVRQWFHDMLKLMDKEENEHFRKTDSVEILKSEIKRYSDIFNHIYWSNIDLNKLNKEQLENIKNMLSSTYDLVYKKLESINKEYGAVENEN